MEELLFTPAALLSILTSVEELKEVNIGLVETLDGKIQLQVGESAYMLEPEGVVDVVVPDTALEAVGQANEDTYQELESSGEVSLTDLKEDVQSGVLKELGKTLMIGGMVRLTAKLLGGK